MSVPSHFGRYRVLRPIAAGEMGTVYLAEDPLIGRQVAIKGLKFSDDASSEELGALQARFDQEIQIAGTFSHPNIVTLFDVGRQDTRSFIAMEFIDGRTLRAELQANGPLPYDAVVAMAAPICRALSYAHDRGVIHRDIKPTNIMLTAGGDPKITDFGVARLAGSTLTRQGKIFGTPAYMSPEQAIGHKLTGASDQFSIAAVVYEMLTGERTFKGDTPTAVIYKIVEDDPTPPEEVNPLVPHRLSRVVMRGLDKLPERRYSSCAELGEALEEAVVWAQANPDAALLGTLPTAGKATTDESRAGGSSGTSPVSGEFLAANLERLAELIRTVAVSPPAQAVVRTVQTRPWTFALVGVFGAALIGSTWALGGASPTVPTPTSATLPARPVAQQSGAQDPGEPSERLPEPLPMVATSYGEPRDVAPDDPIDSAEPGETAAAAEAPAPESAPAPYGDETLAFRVTSRAGGARVILDGQPVATATPAGIEVSAAQRHQIRLELDGYQPILWSFEPGKLTEQHLSNRVLHFPLERVITEQQLASGALNEPLIGPVTTSNGATRNAPDSSPDPAVNEEPAAFDLGEVRRVRAPREAPIPAKTRHLAPEVPRGTAADGMVLLEIEISSRGNVVQAKVLRGLNPALDRAALDAVIRWKYEPTVLAAKPVHVVMTVSVSFSDL